MDIADLEEKAARYKRLLNDEGLLKTLDEMDSMMGLAQNIFGVLKAGQGTDYITAKEGARAYSDKLRNLAAESQTALEQCKQNKGEENE
jgi:hypothetical protein